ncbi:MAG: pyridoxine 5'-phosphate synthase [Rhodospirillales bacterium]|jgi:pyridoxine 5-phosphate synthase|nr:pyridoxine 5'-phosphate synthase [Rhodospirillales bacterium]
MARLSVNLNKIALLRNSRHTGVPDVVHFARIALASGARGITVHPRPDERHIRASDVPAIASAMAGQRPGMEFNIEGYPDPRLLAIVDAVRPEQVTLVPDAPDAFTSERGWALDARERAVAEPAIAALHALGARVILFIDPDPAAPGKARAAGADGVEIYTGSYAAAFRAGEPAAALEACVAAAAAGRDAGLVVNAGHDLNLRNIPPLLARTEFLAEASIGHELTVDALEMGFAAAVAAYAGALGGAAA